MKKKNYSVKISIDFNVENCSEKKLKREIEIVTGEKYPFENWIPEIKVKETK